MNINTLTPADFSYECGAYWVKDAATNASYKGQCQYRGKVVVSGSLAYDRVFTKGEGMTAVCLCNTHLNVANRKPIEVCRSISNLEAPISKSEYMDQLVIHYTTKGTTMNDNCDCNDLDAEGWCECMHVRFNKDHGITMVEDNDAFVQQIHDLAETKAQLQSLTDPRPIYEDDIPVIYINTTKEDTMNTDDYCDKCGHEHSKGFCFAMTKQELDFTPMGHPDWDDPNANPITESEARFYDQEPMWEGEPISMYADETLFFCSFCLDVHDIRICMAEENLALKGKSGVKCGNCKGRHTDVDLVKRCHASYPPFQPEIITENRTCHGCGGSGVRQVGATVNGAPERQFKCNCCKGKGYQTPEDAVRDSYYHALNG